VIAHTPPMLIDRELTHRFGREHVFKAGRSNTPGTDIPDSILDSVARCSLFLAVIDPAWLADRALLFREKDWSGGRSPKRCDTGGGFYRHCSTAPKFRTPVTYPTTSPNYPAERFCECGRALPMPTLPDWSARSSGLRPNWSWPD
jgi:hypothetical protein